MNDIQPIEIDGKFEALDENLVGDSIEHDRGTLSIRHVDIDIPGNSDLPVRFARSYTMHGTAYTGNHLGGWQMDVPFITTRMRVAGNSPGAPGHHLSPTPCFLDAYDRAGANFSDTAAYYQGFKMNIPGEGMKQIMDIPSGASTNFPYQGQHAVTKTTVDHWKIYCEESGGSKTGDVIAVSPTGDKYEFRTLSLTQAGPEVVSVSSGRRGNLTSEIVLTYHHNLMATKVTDVHGNWVAFDYEHEFDYEFLDAYRTVATRDYDSYRLKTIRSNDNRRIDIAYNGANNPGQTIPGGSVQTIDEGKTTTIASVTAHGRTWTYEYAQSGNANYVPIGSFRNLRRVVLPDGRDWVLQLPIQHHRAHRAYNSYKCDVIDDNDPTPQPGPMHWVNDIYVEHPSGAKVEFDFQVIKNPIWKLGTLSTITNSLACDHPDPEYTISNALIRKTIIAPSAPTAIWNFSYDQIAFNDPNLGEVKRRIETRPDGSTIERMVLINNEGDVVRTTTTGGGANYIEKTTYSKLIQFDEHDTIGVLDDHKRYKNPSLKRATQTTITSDGDTFETVFSYNSNLSSSAYSYGAPTNIVRTGTGTGSRTTITNYNHDRDDWVIGLVNTVTHNGKLFDDYDYDSKGRLTRTKRFGVTMANISYYTSGDAAGRINTISDALNRTYSLSSYKRGIARTIIQPDGNSTSRVVNDNGWVTSQTNARNITTSYEYNSMGWLTKINRPGGWANTNISYSSLGNGLTQTTTRGNSRTVTTMDGYHRGVLTKAEDLTGHSSARYIKTSYDGLGRAIFQSYPSFSANPTAGVNTTHDALGRITQLRENVSPFPTTSTAYLSGHRMRVTDPSGAQTTTTYRSYGTPSNFEKMQIVDPLGNVTSMTRDTYGNVTQISQNDVSSYNQDVTRNFWYDDRLRLCRHRAPEFGDELFAYDDANQLTASSRGESAGTNCATPTTARRTSFSYDPMGRQTLINFPSGTADIVKTYDANGNVKTNKRGGVDWYYTYNELDLISKEQVYLDNRGYTIDHGYNTTGHLLSRGIATQPTINFAPNGFGEPTLLSNGASNFVSGISYHANGSVNTANYSNGRNYSQTLTTRLQPYDIKVQGSGGTLVNLRHAYDIRGKVVSITDYAVSGQNRSFGYDARGRLTSANGSWGSGTFTYDGVDNIRQKKLGSRFVDLTYDGTNRVSQFKDTAQGNVWQGLGYDSLGNMNDNGLVAHGAVNLTYDWSSQPVAMVGSGISNSYTYDGNFKRIKTVQNGKTTYWIYSALTGTPIYSDETTDVLKTNYYSAGGAQFRLTNGNPKWTHLNHQGTPIAATWWNGNLAWREHYTPYGEKTAESSYNDNDISYTGHVEDETTNLTYMQARYYDPVIGRFLSTDPMGYQDQANLYAYVANDTINTTDPTGMLRCTGRTDLNCQRVQEQAVSVRSRVADKIEDISGIIEKNGQDLNNYEASTLRDLKKSFPDADLTDADVLGLVLNRLKFIHAKLDPADSTIRVDATNIPNGDISATIRGPGAFQLWEYYWNYDREAQRTGVPIAGGVLVHELAHLHMGQHARELRQVEAFGYEDIAFMAGTPGWNSLRNADGYECLVVSGTC